MRSPTFLLLLSVACCPSNAFAQGDHDWSLDAGPLKLEICVSETAHLFHVVDQIAEWSEFCHRQYVSYFEGLEGKENDAEDNETYNRCKNRRTYENRDVEARRIFEICLFELPGKIFVSQTP